jgi:hypothetical protein
LRVEGVKLRVEGVKLRVEGVQLRVESLPSLARTSMPSTKLEALVVACSTCSLDHRLRGGLYRVKGVWCRV